MTPETYLGYKRGDAYTKEIRIIIPHESSVYQYFGMLAPNEVGLKGEWTVEGEYIRSNSDESTLSLNLKRTGST